MAITHQHDITIHHRSDDLAQGIGIDRWKCRTDRHAATVGSYQYRNLFIRQAALGCLAATAARLAVQASLALAALQDIGLVGLDDTGELAGAPALRGKKPVPPAMRGIDGNPAMLGRLANGHAFGKTVAVLQPFLLVVKPRQGCPGCGTEGPAATLALVAPKTAGSAAQDRTRRMATGTLAVFAHRRLDRRQRRRFLRGSREYRFDLKALFPAEQGNPRQPFLKLFVIHDRLLFYS